MTLIQIRVGPAAIPLAALFSLTIFTWLPAAAAELEAGWLDKEDVVREEIVGAGIRTIEVMPQDGSRKVSIAVPKSALHNRDDVKEVVVIGHRDDEPDRTIKVRHEWATDYENDYYGLVIYLGEDTALPIRLYFKGEEPDSSHRPP